MSEVLDVQTSKADVWFLKEIVFAEKSIKIITQNFNGPCSFIAICNILILRGNITILPKERTSVSYEFLSQLVGEYLLSSRPDVDISAALSIMPLTQKGMDLNPLFTAPTSFRPAGDGGELKLFEQAGIQLVHGWLVDPESNESRVLARTQDYDSAVNLIADADHTTKGQLVLGDDFVESSSTQAGPSSSNQIYTAEERDKIESAIIVRTFLEATRSQLTYHGLFQLASLIEPNSLVALFRSSHLSVLYRTEGEDSSLYTLVTDQIFLHESSVVWERLEDVDGGWSTFVDSDFVKSSPAGGDFAGHTAESALAALEAEHAAQFSVIDPADQALAQQLQEEEDDHARRLYIQREREREARYRKQHAQGQRHGGAVRLGEEGEPKGKKKGCIIM